MKHQTLQFKRIVASVLSFVVFPALLHAQVYGENPELDALYERLQDPELRNWESVEEEILGHWQRSGSEAIDLLLQRGQQSLDGDEPIAAIEHFSAAIDHAPDFAEAYNGRATAFYEMERYGQSLADIEYTLALNPRHFGALTGLALILQGLGQYEDALSAYRAVAAIHPHRPNVKEAIERLEARLEGEAL